MTHRDRNFRLPRPAWAALIAIAAACCWGLPPHAFSSPVPDPLSSPVSRDARGVFVLVTIDKTSWVAYEYGSAFFFTRGGDAYTASHVVTTAVRRPGTMLVAIVDGLEYVAHVVCWNPGSSDQAPPFTRDVAIVHVGPEVPLFPIGVYHPAATPLTAVPFRVQPRRMARPGEGVSVLGYRHYHGIEWEPNIAFTPHESGGRVDRVLSTPDNVAVVSLAFPDGTAPENGESGGPILDRRGEVLGLTAWGAVDGSTGAEANGVASRSLGCVTRIPHSEEQLSPRDAPIRLP